MTDDFRESDGLASRAASGVGWLTAQTWFAKIGGLVTTIVLARLLTPSDFGVVAIAMTILPLIYLLADLGFATYLMQADRIDKVTTSTAFWYCTSAGILLALALVACGPLLEALFGVTGVAVVVSAMSPAVVLVSVAAVPIAVLRRGLRFRTLALQSALAAVVGQAAAILLAVLGAGVWALVAQILVAQAVTFAAAWISSRWLPRWLFDWGQFKAMVRFGSSVVGINGIAVARLWAENAIVSNVLGVAALGQLSIAQRLVQTAQDLAGSAISPVSTVVFAQVRDDSERLMRGYQRALAMSYLLIAPTLTVVAVTAPLLVPWLFGSQWTPSVPASQALSLAAIFTMGAVLDHGLFYGLGRPATWLVYATAIDALTVVATLLTARFGITAIALGFLVTAGIATIVRWVIVARALRASIWSVARPTVATLLSVAISGAAGLAIVSSLSTAPPVIGIGLASLAVFTIQLGLSWFLLPGALLEIVRFIRARVGPARLGRGRA